MRFTRYQIGNDTPTNGWLLEDRIGPVEGNPSQIRRHIQNSMVAAIDISIFVDVNQYKEHIDNLIDGLKSLPRANGFNEIFMPGELEERTSRNRSKNGIPISSGTASRLRQVGEKLGIRPPQKL